MDQIKIDNLKIFAHHGVFDFEKEKGQNFYINAILYINLHKAGCSDDLNESTNYGEVCQFISDSMQKKTYNLIEAVAENLAKDLLIQFSKIVSLELEIRKPQAPIPLSFESVSVKISRGWHDVYLSFGSNMGDKERYIRNGLEELNQRDDCRIIKVSSLITTKPYGEVEQDNFLNGACHIKTLLTKDELLHTLQQIEKNANRERKVHWGPRTLDMDILFYDKEIYEDDQLIIPHVDIQNRLFVLEPMCQIAPNFMHPIFQKTIRIMYEELKNKTY